MKNAWNWLVAEESGQGMVEYGLIIALISVVAIVALGKVGGKLNGIFTGIEGDLSKTQPAPTGK